ncbi:MAG: PD-(D/E)XK nuclease family protein [Oligoflexales bacterium]|nr:PD-(D/E)XK nuclease family protein [Oligoflexales bacterium]
MFELRDTYETKSPLLRLCEDLSLHPFPSRVLVVLPTESLIYSFKEQMVRMRIPAPTVLSLDDFLDKSCQRAFKSDSLESPKLVLNDRVCEDLLSLLIRKKSYKHLHAGHIHEIQQLFSQLSDSGLGEEVFEDLLRGMSFDVHRAEEGLQALAQRFRELSALHKDFHEILVKRQLTTRSLDTREKCSLLLDRENFQDLQEVYIACFTSVKPAIADFFRTIASFAHVKFYVSDPLHSFYDVSPLADLIRTVGLQVRFEKMHKLRAPHFDTRVVELESSWHEAFFAVEEIKKYLHLGLRPGQLAIIVTDEKKHTKFLKLFLRQSGLQANFSMPKIFSEGRLGSFLLNLCDYILSRESCGHSLYVLITHPLWQNLLKEVQGSFLSVERLSFDMSEKIQKNSFTLEYLLEERVSDDWTPLLSLIDAKLKCLHASSKLSVWIERMNDFCLSFSVEELLADFEDLKSCQKDLTSLSSIMDSYLSPFEFFSLFKKTIRKLKVKNCFYQDSSDKVQVLSLMEARYLPFEAAIILGCLEGVFPRGLPKDLLVSDSLKKHIGLPSWRYFEALEDITFQVLCQTIPTLILVYSKKTHSGVKSRSRFIETLLLRSLAVFEKVEKDELSSHFDQSLESSLLPDLRRGQFLSDPKEMASSFSATSLSYLLQCPYRFLLHKMGLVRNRLLVSESDSIFEGQWLHQVMETFYTGLCERGVEIKALPRSMKFRDEEEALQFATKRLGVLSEALAASSMKGSPFYKHLMMFSWPRFAEHWVKFLEPSNTGLAWSPLREGQELSLESLSVELDLPSWPEKIQLQGFIDSVIDFGSVFILTDYKRKAVDSVRDMSEGLAPQLLFYALAYSRFLSKTDSADPNLEKGLVGYFSVLSGLWYSRAVGNSARDWSQLRDLARTGTASLSELVRHLVHVWDSKLEQHFVQKKDFHPSPGGHCTFCSYAGACRVG